MTFTFDTATIRTDTLAFNIPNGPELAYLQLWSQMANQQLVGRTTNPLDWWATNSQGLVLQLVESNSRYSEYLFKYSGVDGIDGFQQIFTKDVQGIYNWRLSRFADDFIWNLNQNLYNLEPRLWTGPGNLVEIPLDEGVIKIKNVDPTNASNKKTYQSTNETRAGYVYLTNNSI